MILNKIEDPRDSLDKARRQELFLFAQASGVTEITNEMPAILMRDILRRRGLTRIRLPPRPLGGQGIGQPSAAVSEQNGIQADAVSDLARQWQAQQQSRPLEVGIPAAPAIDEKTDINVLRRMCQARDIPMGRRDRKPDLIAKIKAHDGQNAPQRDQ